MTYFYKTYSWGNNSTQGIPEGTRKLWEHIVEKKNWRIVELPNGFFQAEHKDLNDENKWIDVTRRETVDSCETAIDESIEHYLKKIEFLKGPKVVKSFK